MADAPADPRAALAAVERWPTWMWANEEMVDFCRWLRAHNQRLDERARVGLHGLDVYSLSESLREVLRYLREHDPDLLPAALAAYRCFEPYGEDPQLYALSSRFIPYNREDEVVDLLVGVRKRAGRHAADGFSARQNAEVLAGAERYYRAMVAGGRQAWNARERHLAETLDRLLRHYGPGSKAVVWAHNTHVGDARATDMAAANMVTVGQLGRERYGPDGVVLVGFGCYGGGVVAAQAWGAPMETLPVPPARRGSLEDALHDGAPPRALLVFPEDVEPGVLTDWLDQRAIGVVYHPDREHWGNYAPTRLGERYDAFCWLDQTWPVRPLHTSPVRTRELDTFPMGV